MTKLARQQLIVELVHQGPLPNQQELVKVLVRRGFQVTQATLSRDINELRLVKTAEGYVMPNGDASTENVSSKEPNDAVKKPDASGKSTNDLEVRGAADKIDYVVNGTVVHSTPKSGATSNTDGIYGIRVNHLLEVQVDGLTASK